MTPLEVRKLIGGYAAGSLSDAERRLLFEAALDDQELFDRLMGEHALKELLQEPKTRARLIAALSPASKPPKPFWDRAWPCAAASAAVALGAVLSFAVFWPSPPKLVARAFHPPAVVLNSVTPVQSPLPSPPELRITPPPAPKLDFKTVLSAPPPPAPRAAQFAAGFIAGAASQAALAAPNFIYTLSDDGKLRITPLVNGFLTVLANTDQVVASNRPVQASGAVEFTMSPDANLATVFLTPQPAPPLSPPADVRMVRISVKPRDEK